MAYSKAAKSVSVPTGLVMGAACSFMITVIICAFFAKLIETEVLSPNTMNYASAAALLCASASGSWMCLTRVKQKPLLVCLLSGTIYLLILLAINISLCTDSIQGVGVTILLVIAGSLVPALLKSRGGVGQKSGHKKYRYR